MYELEFYAEDGGVMPALRWIKDDLSPTKRRALGMAMNEVLQRHGVQVVGERSWGSGRGVVSWGRVCLSFASIALDGLARDSGRTSQAAAWGLRTRAQASVAAETMTAVTPSPM